MGQFPGRFERLAGGHHRVAFSCGVDALDRYLRQQAGPDQRRNLAVVYVLIDGAAEAIVGYYTLSTFSILPVSLPEAVTRKLARYEAFPAILLGRLAVDRQYQGKGFGGLLLVDALQRSLGLSERIGAMAVVVDAKDENARTFYERYGFLRLRDHENRLYLPIATIAQLW